MMNAFITSNQQKNCSDEQSDSYILAGNHAVEVRSFWPHSKELQMRLTISSVAGLCCAVLIGLVMTTGVQAQTKAKAQKAEAPAKAAKSSTVQGTVRLIGSGQSTITVRVKTVDKTVVYSPDTKFLSGYSDKNKPGDIKQVKEGNYISCAGTLDAKSQLMAKQCIYREAK
jgi:hypothetical protein